MSRERSPQAAQSMKPAPSAPLASAPRVDAVAEWRSTLSRWSGALLAGVTTTGLTITFSPFGELPQFSVVIHTILGLVLLAPVTWYIVRHWLVRRHGAMSHYQLLGYAATAALLVCVVSGLVGTWRGVVGPRVERVWDLTHLVSGIVFFVLVAAHLLTVIVRKVGKSAAAVQIAPARAGYWRASIVGAALPLVAAMAWVVAYDPPGTSRAFPDSYNWRFGEDRPFAPSMARVAFADGDGSADGDGYADGDGSDDRLAHTGAVDPSLLANSSGCGTSGCHSEIYHEWLPSAHRYASMDDMFQKVQTIMAEETSPEHTRYCAGCHDPISLFSGAKDSNQITLSSVGADEGISCLVCHSIVQADVQGNADYTLQPPHRYAYELDQSGFAKFLSDFLIRTYPVHHISSYSRALYKTPEFCAACHKQYIDQEVNTDIGKVQGQNQYDSWKNSRWHVEGAPERSVGCRECHMPLNPSTDPARGDQTDFNRSLDDQCHRSHRTLASNQYIPILHDLPGAANQVALTEQWLRGEYEIPEIKDRWTEGPVVRMSIQAPNAVSPGESVPIRVALTNNKTGHDFPTGPLDMIESWVELKATDSTGAILYHVGAPDASGDIGSSPVIFRKDGFDREGKLIDRHNLWDLVGAKYARTLYPGVTDTVEFPLQCPSMARGRLAANDDRTAPGVRVDDFSMTVPDATDGDAVTVEATLWYRKANPAFLDRVYGADPGIRSPCTAISHATKVIPVRRDVAQRGE